MNTLTKENGKMGQSRKHLTSESTTLQAFEENLSYYDQDNIVAESYFESFETEENEPSNSDYYSASCSSQELEDPYLKNSVLRSSSILSTTTPDSIEDITTPKCPICLQIYQEQCYLYPCYHTFCVSCIRQWLYVVPDCPLCKYKVKFLITDIDDSKGTFNKLYIDDTMNNDTEDKMKRQKWISEISNITEHNKGLKSKKSKRDKIYLENLFPTNVPIRSKGIFTFNEFDIERVRPFITRDLKVLLSDTYDIVVDEYVFSVISLFYKKNKTENEVTEMLKPWLGKSAEKFVHEINRFAESELDIDTWDKLVSYA